MNWPTPRDLIAIDPNPARLRVKDIADRFHVSKEAASAVRRLATQAPEVLERFRPGRVG